jgi:DNA-binding NarL/FixJ family response regulator
MTPRAFPRILIVDDFKEWRLQARSILQTRPECQIVGEASDGFEAVQKAGKLHADMILMDIALPDLNGIEAANRILQMSPGF